MSVQVAMDGPVGAGKSTIARETAKRLGYIYVDTGALYRTVGLYMSRESVNLSDGAAVSNALSSGITLDIRLIDGTQHVLLNGEDVSDEIRLPEMSMMASKVSAIPAVRDYLLGTQRELAARTDVIMDGRDIGTVILPNADVKIYITAAAEVRAKRRYDELCAKGVEVKLEDVLADLNRRDYNDMHREVAPLKRAEDAVLLDTGAMDFEQSVAAVMSIIGEKC